MLTARREIPHLVSNEPRILTPTAHGVLDYLVALAFLLAPTLFDFGDRATVVSYLVAATHAIVSLITRYPLGVFRLIAFPTHGLIETLAAVGVIAFPWLLQFSSDEPARNFFVVVGLTVLLVVVLTDYRRDDLRTGTVGDRRL
jgi:hypothetical protein